MQKVVVRKSNLAGSVGLPGDKSISHRAVILGSIATGITTVKGLLKCEDTTRTIRAFRQMGVRITQSRVRGPASAELRIEGRGLYLERPKGAIGAGNSGTTMRLICGILAGQDFSSRIVGDKSLSKRPMKRITMPLRSMGAGIQGRDGNYAPLRIKGGSLNPLPSPYKLEIPSAQVKSCILFAHLYTEGMFKLVESARSRDHTERMLRYFGARIKRNGPVITLRSPSPLKGRHLSVPGDISSASFFLVAAALGKRGKITMGRVGVNPTRSAILTVLKQMGAVIKTSNKATRSGEPVADLCVIPSTLKGISIRGAAIPAIMDEIPILAVAATQAKGRTVIRDAGELRVKETDRIRSMVEGLGMMGANIKELKDGMAIQGPARLKGTEVNSYGDHRTAMALVIAGLIADGETIIRDTGCIGTSFPGFLDALKGTGAVIKIING